MPEAVNPRSGRARAYDSSRRQEQARQTRRAVLDAAHRLFVEQGYAKTTMAAVAGEVGVSVETVYKAFGNKPGLVKAVFDVAVVGDDEPVPLMQRELVQRIETEPDACEKLRIYGAHLVTTGARTAAILLVVRSAAATDDGAAELWEQLQAERLTGMSAFAKHLDEGGHLRTGVSAAEARDVVWTHNSVEMWDLLVIQRGWSAERFGAWIGQQLIAALL
jgi:AcrR family transcriptional regulator